MNASGLSPAQPQHYHQHWTSSPRQTGRETRIRSLPDIRISGESSEEQLHTFPIPEISSTTLRDKPTAKLAYTYYPASQSPNPFSRSLIVFLNGLILPRSSWDASISSFLDKRISSGLPYPSLLTYDRYGQGESDNDPSDPSPPPCHGHDLLSAVHSLRHLITQIWKERLDISNPIQFPALIFVCSSIGCPLARLFAEEYPGTVSAMLFLDSNMANSDFVSFWPDPDQPHFDSNSLPPGISPSDVRATRAKYHAMFGPEVPNQEGLSRRNLASLLPESSAPHLEGWDAEGPYLTVVGHDWEEFAEQCFQGSLKTPKVLVMTYLNPEWQRYNEGLVKITDHHRAIGPIIAVGCGHLIMKDDPGFVADEMSALLDRVVNRSEQLMEM